MSILKRQVKSKLHKVVFATATAILTLTSSLQGHAQEANQDLDAILNYRQYTPLFSSAGQPSREQFSLLKDDGYDRVINNPTVRDFNAFADAMEREPESKTILHCQVNARATAFSLLYRVVYQGVSLAQAKEDMNTVWQPNAVWRDFIFDVLAAHDISNECEECDWTPPPSQ